MKTEQLSHCVWFGCKRKTQPRIVTGWIFRKHAISLIGGQTSGNEQKVQFQCEAGLTDIRSYFYCKFDSVHVIEWKSIQYNTCSTSSKHAVVMKGKEEKKKVEKVTTIEQGK